MSAIRSGTVYFPPRLSYDVAAEDDQRDICSHHDAVYSAERKMPRRFKAVPLFDE